MSQPARTIEQKRAAARRNAQQISVPAEIASVLIAPLTSIDTVQAIFRAKLFNLQELLELQAVTLPASQVPIPGYTGPPQFDAEVQVTLDELRSELDQVFSELFDNLGFPPDDRAGPDSVFIDLTTKEQIKKDQLEEIIAETQRKAFDLVDFSFGQGISQNPINGNDNARDTYYQRVLILRDTLIPAFLATLQSTIDEFTLS